MIKMVVLTVLFLLFGLYDCLKVYACNIFSPHNPKDVHLQEYLVKDTQHHHPPLPVHWHHHHPTVHSHHETQGSLMTVTPCWLKCITLKAMSVLYKKNYNGNTTILYTGDSQSISNFLSNCFNSKLDLHLVTMRLISHVIHCTRCPSWQCISYI